MYFKFSSLQQTIQNSPFVHLLFFLFQFRKLPEATVTSLREIFQRQFPIYVLNKKRSHHYGLLEKEAELGHAKYPPPVFHVSFYKI